jgi:uncharacterized membrane protein
MKLPPFVPGLLILSLSVPLFFKKIPRNPLYGLRTRTTMASDDAWYSANRVAGAGGSIGGAIWLIAALTLPRFGVSAGYITLIGIGAVGIGIGFAANLVD